MVWANSSSERPPFLSKASCPKALALMKTLSPKGTRKIATAMMTSRELSDLNLLSGNRFTMIDLALLSIRVLATTRELSTL
jgi:hypothetical protein